jgi:Gnt-I system low-affinity gluconate transporter
MVILYLIASIIFLLFLILRLKLPAFISLLITSILLGMLCGMNGASLIETIQKGMGSTLGFVATVVGLGAIFGAILEYSGGALSLAAFFNDRLGEKRTPLSLAITGFLVGIPVFFDVGFIILLPIIYALQQKTGKSILYYALPLLTGLAVTHTFIPPTPGPIAVAEILNANLGWVIGVGFIAGIPTVIVAGLWVSKYIARNLHLPVPEGVMAPKPYQTHFTPKARNVIVAIMLPIALIMIASLAKAGIIPITHGKTLELIMLIGHPFSALIFANLWVWYFMGLKNGISKELLLDVSTKSFAPAGTIILVTGAGGAFKQILIETGVGEFLAIYMERLGLPLLFFAFLTAALIRIAQGSATVAMITAAGLIAPVVEGSTIDYSNGQLAAMVISIASGATIMSHVNDSGYWLIKQYLGMNETQGFQTWTLTSTVIAVVGFLSSAIIFTIL